MRVDVYLHRVCVLKSRTLAKEAADRGKVLVNDEVAKGSRTVQAGDRIRLDLGVRVIELEVLEVPPGRIPKKRVDEFVRVLSSTRVDLDD